jgi:hypothetical protein
VVQGRKIQAHKQDRQLIACSPSVCADSFLSPLVRRLPKDLPPKMYITCRGRVQAQGGTGGLLNPIHLSSDLDEHLAPRDQELEKLSDRAVAVCNVPAAVSSRREWTMLIRHSVSRWMRVKQCMHPANQAFAQNRSA